MNKQGKQYLVADKFGKGSIVCENLFSAVVEYVSQRPMLTAVLLVVVLPVVVATALMSVA